MKSKDTVILQLCGSSDCQELCHLYQAEITWPVAFKAGMVQGKMDMLLDQPGIIEEARQAGIEEVVEWLLGDCPHDHINGPRINCYQCMGDGLQAKLTDWGKE